MTVDVGTTPRKGLSPTQRLKLFEDHKGICVLCEIKIQPGEKWRDEHLRALGLGGGNEWENRGPVHERCADLKNKDDIPRIAKAKRQKMAALGIKQSVRPLPFGRRSPVKALIGGGTAVREKWPSKTCVVNRKLYEDAK